MRVGLGKSFDFLFKVDRLYHRQLVDGPIGEDQVVVAHLLGPETGRIVVALTDSTGRSLEGHTVDLDRVLEPDQAKKLARQSHSEVTDDEGRAIFDQVPVGQTLRVRSRRLGLEETAQGPVEAGHEVHVHLTLDYPGRFLIGRVLNAGAEPLPNQSFALSMDHVEGKAAVTLKTDGEGRFKQVIPGQLIGAEFESAVLRPTNGPYDGRPEVCHVAFPRVPPPGTTDLGDLTLHVAPLVLSGTLVDFNRPELSRPGLSIEREVFAQEDGNAQRTWVTDTEIPVVHLGERDFEFRGRPPPGRLRLVGSVPG
jgi:hypothetical protein